MKTMLLKLSVLTLLATSLMACSRESIDSNFLANDVNGNNNIYRSYRVDYNEANSKGMATATLSVGSSYGATVRLVSPASIQINNSPAREKTDVMDGGELGAFFLGWIFPPAWLMMNASGTTYHQKIYDKTAVFEFVDMNGKRFSDSIVVPNLYLSMPSVAPSSGFNINVIGASASEISITVRLTQGSFSQSVFGSSSQVTVPANYLQSFGPGPIEVSVQVEQNQNIKSDGESLGGELKTSYSFSKRQIVVR
jgi:hypothetical protein